ncbi:putative poly(A)-specific ribonuclease [Dioscorea sansibarensis]
MMVFSCTRIRASMTADAQQSVVCKSKLSGSLGQISPKSISLEDGGDITRCFNFCIVSYNILAQVYVKSSYFPGSPSSCFNEIDSCVSCHGWKARSQVILTTLKSFNADFLCVQVQWCNASADFSFPGRNYHVFSPHLYLLRLIINIRGALWIMWLELDEYDSFYKGNLESTGYSGIYIQRNGLKRDGCGIVYKPNWKHYFRYGAIISFVHTELLSKISSGYVQPNVPLQII